MTAPTNGDGVDLMVGVRHSATVQADRLDAEADRLAAKVVELRYRAFGLRMLHDTASRLIVREVPREP